jgi:hypothetical protein
MQLYIIQYPSIYSNSGSLQRLIVANNDLVRSALIDDKEGVKTRSKTLNVFHTQKRRLQ